MMQATIQGAPTFAYIGVTLGPGETIVAESDAMSSMSANLGPTARFNGGFFSGLLGGEGHES